MTPPFTANTRTHGDTRTHLAVGVDVDPLVIVAEQQLHAVGVGQRDDGVRGHRPLRVLRHVDVVHAAIKPYHNLYTLRNTMFSQGTSDK